MHKYTTLHFFQFLQPGPILTVISFSTPHSSSVIVPRHLKWVTLSSSSPIIFMGSRFPDSFCLRAKSINWVFSLLTLGPLSLRVLFPRIQILSHVYFSASTRYLCNVVRKHHGFWFLTPSVSIHPWVWGTGIGSMQIIGTTSICGRPSISLIVMMVECKKHNYKSVWVFSPGHVWPN